MQGQIGLAQHTLYGQSARILGEEFLAVGQSALGVARCDLRFDAP
jgi:hypothetical protein